MSHPSADHTTRENVVARTLGATGMLGVGLIHLIDAPGKFEETPYMGWLYIGLIAASALAAFLLMREGAATAWALAACLSIAALIGFTLTRTVGLPQARGDIGNWSEPIGMAALYVEFAVVALSVYVLARRGTDDRRH